METYATYRKMLRVNKHRLDDELEIQAECQQDIAEEVARLGTRMEEKREALKKCEARLHLDIRSKAEAKVTKDEVEAHVLRHSDRAEAFNQFQDARENHERWNSLMFAWIARGRAMEQLGALWGRSYYSTDSAGRRAPSGRDHHRAFNSKEEPRSRRVREE